MGSLVMTAFSTYLHRTHSNRRCSKPTGPGLIRVSIMRDVQRKQRRRSMDVSNGPPGKQAVGAMLHLWTQAGAQILSVTDGSRRPRGDIKSFAQCQASHWSKLLTFGKIHIRHRLSSDPFHAFCFRRHLLDLLHVVVLKRSRVTIIPRYCDITPSRSDDRAEIAGAIFPANAVVDFKKSGLIASCGRRSRGLAPQPGSFSGFDPNETREMALSIDNV